MGQATNNHRIHSFIVILAILLLSGLAFGKVTVTAKLVDGQGNGLRTAYLHWELWGCGTNSPIVYGQPQTIVGTSFDAKPNPATGIITRQVIANDQILCGGFASTEWAIQPMADPNTPIGPALHYFLHDAVGAIDFSAMQPTAAVPPIGLLDPGANGIVTRTAPSVTGVATAADVDLLFGGAGKCYLFKGATPGTDDGCDMPSSGAAGSPSGSLQGNNSGVFAGVPGTSVDFTNGTINIAPTGTGVPLTLTGDSHSSNIQNWFVYGGSTPIAFVDRLGVFTLPGLALAGFSTGCLMNTSGVVSSTGLPCGSAGGGGGGGGGGPALQTNSSFNTDQSLLNLVNSSANVSGLQAVVSNSGAAVTVEISGTLAHGALPALVSADIPNNAANTSGQAGAALALAATPTQCSGSFATGIAANGNANCGTPGLGTYLPLSGGTLTGQLISSVTATAPFSVASTTPVTNLSIGGTAPFAGLQAGTNTHAFLMGTSGSLSYTGTGIVNANSLLNTSLPSLASGYLRWTGTTWAFGNPPGSGTVTAFSAGALSPVFSTSVATSTTTPALSFSLSNAAAYTVFGNPSGSSGAPGYTTNPAVSSVIIEGSSSGSCTITVSATAGTLNLCGNATVTGAGTVAAVGFAGPLTGTASDASGLQGNALPSLTTGYLQWTGAMWAFGDPTGTGGTVTTFTAGDLSPLFTSSVATPTSTPALTFSLSNAPGNSLFGNSSGSNGAPSYAYTVGSTGSDIPQLSSGVLQSSEIPNNGANTTGSAAKWTTARLVGGNSVDGSANVAFANKFIVQGTTDTGLSGAQFLGSLSTGILKVTTLTGALSTAVAADFPTLNQPTTGSSGGLTGCTTSTAGSICYWNGSAWVVLAGNTTATHWLQETSSGIPSWTATPVASVFGRTGAVAATSGDYSVAQVTGAAADSAVVHNTGTETIAGAKTFTSAISAPGFTGTGSGPAGVQTPPVTYSVLNAAIPCNSGNEGTWAAVTDSTVNTWGATVTGGGSYHEPVYCNGSNWTVR